MDHKKYVKQKLVELLSDFNSNDIDPQIAVICVSGLFETMLAALFLELERTTGELAEFQVDGGLLALKKGLLKSIKDMRGTNENVR